MSGSPGHVHRWKHVYYFDKDETKWVHNVQCEVCDAIQKCPHHRKYVDQSGLCMDEDWGNPRQSVKCSLCFSFLYYVPLGTEIPYIRDLCPSCGEETIVECDVSNKFCKHNKTFELICSYCGYKMGWRSQGFCVYRDLGQDPCKECEIDWSNVTIL